MILKRRWFYFFHHSHVRFRRFLLFFIFYFLQYFIIYSGGARGEGGGGARRAFAPQICVLPPSLPPQFVWVSLKLWLICWLSLVLVMRLNKSCPPKHSFALNLPPPPFCLAWRRHWSYITCQRPCIWHENSCEPYDIYRLTVRCTVSVDCIMEFS